MTNSWIKQTSDTPAFPDMVWSQPENKLHAGKLLIVGGNLHGFSTVGEGYTQAMAAGIGTVRVILPDALLKTVQPLIPEAFFGPSTPSGSFGIRSLDTWLEHATWADATLIAGDLGRNSETAVIFERFCAKYGSHITLVGDAIDILITQPSTANNSEMTLVMTLEQVQKLAQGLRAKKAFISSMNYIEFVAATRELSNVCAANLVVIHDGHVAVAAKGQLSTTAFNNTQIHITTVAAFAAVWTTQNPDQQFQALTTSLVAS